MKTKKKTKNENKNHTIACIATYANEECEILRMTLSITKFNGSHPQDQLTKEYWFDAKNDFDSNYEKLFNEAVLYAQSKNAQVQRVNELIPLQKCPCANKQCQKFMTSFGRSRKTYEVKSYNCVSG